MPAGQQLRRGRPRARGRGKGRGKGRVGASSPAQSEGKRGKTELGASCVWWLKGTCGSGGRGAQEGWAGACWSDLPESQDGRSSHSYPQR